MVTEEKKVKLNKGAEKKMDHIFGYIINPQLWSPDSPQLYKVEATLLDPKGKPSHRKIRKLSMDLHSVTNIRATNAISI